MANIYIDTDRTKNIASQLDNMQKYMKDIKAELNQTRSSLKSAAPALYYYNPLLSNIEQSVLNEAVKMDSLASALEHIIDSYIQTESKNTGTGAGTPSLGFDPTEGSAISRSDENKNLSLIDRIYKQITEWLKDWGVIAPDRPVRTPGEEVTAAQESQMDRYMRWHIDEVLSEARFSKITWMFSSASEREAILRDFYNRVIEIMGLDVDGLVFFDRQSANGYVTMGSYNGDTNTVNINSWVIANSSNSYDLMSTMVHELRHAYQHAACNDPERFMVSRETIEEWQDSFVNYRGTDEFMVDFGIDRDEAYRRYRAQAVESDARDFANQD